MQAGKSSGVHRYWPQLDGVRALAIAGVVAFHLGSLSGGWVGVDVFFVLSGYLITSLLLGDRAQKAFAGLRGFWARRARRLLPAVLLLIVALSIFAALGGPGLVPAQLRSPALATLFYVANWQQIVAGHGYFAQFTAPSPLQQTWSLAIEEQYYLIWPLLLGCLLFVSGRWGRRGGRIVLGSTLVLAVASAAWMGVAAHILGPNRAYLGTDTRAWELLIGGAAAMAWRLADRRPTDQSRLWSVLGPIGLVGIVVGACLAGGPPWWIWNGGLVGIACCAGVVIVSVLRAPTSPLARILSFGPIRWVGLISYSLYLWHWPTIVLMTPDTTGLSGTSLLLSRLGAMTAASCASYYLVERPLRRADWAGWARRLRVQPVSFAALGVGVTAVAILLGTVGPPQATSSRVSLAQIAAQTAKSVSAERALGAGAGPTTTTVPPASQFDLPPASPSSPYRLWIFGDSVMQDASLGVSAALGATGEVTTIENSAIGGWGMWSDTNWPDDANPTGYRPQIVIGTWSWDNQVAQTNPVAYQQRLQSSINTLLQDGVELVVILQFPQPGPDNVTTSQLTYLQREADWAQMNESQAAWDTAAEQAVAAFPGHALYLRTNELFAPNSYFSAWMKTPQGTWIRARKLDNAHFCPYGAAELGALVDEELTPILHLGPMATGWELGNWTQDARYNDPAGACPADQPPTPDYNGIQVPAVDPGYAAAAAP